MLLFRLRLALLLALATLVLSTACTARADGPTPLIASVNRSGEVTVRRAADDQVIATIHLGLFEQTWQLHGVGRGADYSAGPNGAIVTQSSIAAPTAGTTVAVKTTVEAAGNALKIRCEMTPEKPVAVNSTQVSVSLPVTAYIGATWAAGSKIGTVPATAKDTQLVTGLTDSLTIGAGDKQIRVSPVGSPTILQDNRVFNGSDLEVRVGIQGDRTMPAGKIEAIALTVGLPGAVTLEKEEPITLTAGDDWIPLDLKLDITPGSALDFSSMLQEAPAGKYGRVVVRGDGHFGFEKRDKPVRFYGVNLAFSANYLNHDEADRLADRLARIGYNTVRIHHYESELIDENAPDSLTFRADSLDKLDYLIAALKKRGIYVKMDLFVSRPVRPSETGVGEADYKAALLVSPPAMENWKAFTRKLLTHVNPYTGLAYKDDPALAFISLVNEPNATTFFSGLKGELHARYEAEWTAYLKARYPNDAAIKAAWNDPSASLTMPMPDAIGDAQPSGREAAAFATTLHLRAWHTMRDFLRKEVGTKALLTYLNGWSEAPAFMVARTEFDWVDNHFYWDHPRFLEKEWSLPSEGGSGGVSAIAAGGAGPNGFAMTRLFGKPFTWSEFNYAAPNRYRAEGGLLMGAASALQDWDAVWRFAYAHSREAEIAPAPVDYFNMVSDPAGQASERAALMLFLRGDVKPAPDAVALVRSAQDLMAKPSVPSAPGFGDLTFVARVGTRVEAPGDSLPKAPTSELRLTTGSSADGLAALKAAGRLPTANDTDLVQARRESQTGEILIDGEKGLMRIATERTAGGVALPGTTLDAGSLTIAVADARAAVWASSLDGKPLAQSKRLLLCHVTDVENTNMRYGAPDRRVLEEWGGLPHLARRGAATVTLQRKAGEKLEAWRLDTAGNRVAPLPVEAKGTDYVLHLDTKAADGRATLYYEVQVR